MPQQPDYATLAAQYGGRRAEPGTVDYASLARQYNGTLATPEDPRSFFSRAFDRVFTAPEAVTSGFRAGAERIDRPSLDRSPTTARLRGFAAGAVEQIGHLLTPGDIALTALGFGPLAQAVRGVRGGARVVDALQGAANLATVARGGERALDAESASEALAGAAQMAFGTIGAMPGPARPAPPPPVPRAALPPGARFRAAPGGVVAEAGTEIPMVRQPDGSFVRGVPAEYARREVRGELPAGPRFIAGEGGRVAPVDDPASLAKLAAEFGGQPVASSAASASTGRMVPAAVVARDVDTTKPTKQAITVRQFSGDPAATDAPLLSDAETRMLRRMRRDLDEFTPQRGRLIRDPQDDTSSIYAHGTRGSYVGEDIRTISEQNVGNDKIARAIDDLLEGKTPSNKLHVAAIDAARGYVEGRPGYRGPIVPDEFADAPRSQPEGGTAAVAGDDEDFEAFAKAFEDVAPDPRGEPGEAGFIAPQLAAHLAGGAGGAAAGYASAEDDESTLKMATRTALGAALGTAAPALLRRSGGPQPATRRASVTTTAAAKVQQATATLGPVPVSGAARPPRTGRQGEPIDKPLEGFEPFLSKFNPLARQGIERVIRENAGFAQQRRGHIGTGDLGKFVSAVHVDARRALPRGTALSGEAITGYARALQQTTKKVDDLAGKVNAGTATDADVVALEAARAEQEVIAKSLVGARAEAGRALAAFNFYRGILDSGSVELIRGAATPLREEAARIAKGIAALPADPLKRYEWLREQATVSPWSYARTYYIANLLSGPKTHARNILSNLFNGLADLVMLPIAAGIDVAKSTIKGTPRTVRLSELPARLQGDLVGIEKGFTDMLFAFRHGIHPAALTQKVELAATRGKLDLPAPELPGGGYNPLNWPFRALHGPDAFFRAVAREGELSAILFNVSKNEGKSGQALLDRVAELRAGMTPEAVAIREQAADYAARRVFLEEPGAMTKRVQLLAEKVPGSWLVAPFIRITAAIGRQGAQFSPFGFLMKEARKDGRAGTQAQARAAAGTMAAGYLFWLASTGRLSGSGPSDPAERAALMERGWRPNSIRVGDQWASYQVMQPLSVPMAVIANATEAWHDRGSRPEQVVDVIAQVFSRTANSFLDTSFLSGVFDFVEALKDPERNASRFFGRMAFGFVPGASAVRTVQQMRDPVVRQPDGFVENMQAQVPGLSESVPARVSRFGETVVREGSPVRRAVDPFNVSSETGDPVAAELSRLGVNLTLPSARLELPGGRRLTDQQEQALKQARGRAVRVALDRVMRQRSYQRGSDLQRHAMVEHAIGQARRRVSEQARRELVGARR